MGDRDTRPGPLTLQELRYLGKAWMSDLEVLERRRDALLREAAAAGFKPREIAEAFGQKTIKMRLDKLGIPRRPPGRPRGEPQRTVPSRGSLPYRIADLMVADPGVTNASMAIRFDVSKQAIHAAMKRWGTWIAARNIAARRAKTND